jgi:Glyoxalase-like domain
VAGVIDHLVLAGPDLDGLVAWFVAVSGVDPAPGGAHVGLGTRNALVGLGGSTYLELVGPDPDQPEPDAPRPFGVDELEEPRLVTWCLRPTIPLGEAVEVTRRHGWDPGSIAAMSRRRPDGELLRWRLTLRPMVPEVAAVPFFIDWLDSEHPTASLPMAVALTSLTVSHPDPDRLASLLAALGAAGVTVTGGSPSLVAALMTPNGLVELH